MKVWFRWVSFPNGWFLGSMSIFRAVAVREIYRWFTSVFEYISICKNNITLRLLSQNEICPSTFCWLTYLHHPDWIVKCQPVQTFLPKNCLWKNLCGVHGSKNVESRVVCLGIFVQQKIGVGLVVHPPKLNGYPLKRVPFQKKRLLRFPVPTSTLPKTNGWRAPKWWAGFKNGKFWYQFVRFWVVPLPSNSGNEGL